MSKCADGDDALNSVINRYLKRRNYATPSQSVLSDNKFTIKELIANEFVLNIGSYDHLIEFSTSHPNKLDYFNNCNNCLDEFLNFLDQLSLENEGKLSFSFSIFIHLFIDLFVNDLKPEAKQFFNNHQHKFSSFSQFKRTFDMLNNSLKSQQLDKRLAKLRCSKVSVSISESDHKLLLEFLENESLSRSLHQIINQNFSFSLSPDEECVNAVQARKRSATDSLVNYSCLNGDDPETTFNEFGGLFMCNGKSKSDREMSREENDQMEICRNENSSSGLLGAAVSESERQSPEDESLEAEFNRLINNLKVLPSQLPEVLVYKLSSDHSHVCCADLRSDLRYCCAGTEGSEVLVFPTELKSNYDLSTSKWLAGEEESKLVEEKVDRTRQLNKSFSFYGHHGPVLDLKFVPNSSYLLSCSSDSNSILWDLNGRESTSYLKKKYYGHTQPIYSLDVNCLGTHFATGSKDSTSRLFALDRSNLLRSFVGHQNSINCVHFHPNSKYLATGSSDHSVRMWDISSSNMVRVFNCQTEVYSLCYSTDGQFLASAGADGKVKIWDLSNGKLLIEFNSSHSQPINSLSFNATSTVLVSSSIDQQINFWNFRSAKKDEMSVEPLLAKNLLIKVRRARFTHSDLLVAFGT